MKVHWYWQRWTPVKYGLTDLGKFRFWSNPLMVDGSQKVVGLKKTDYGPGTMNWLRKNYNWPECVILDPWASADAEFLMGFSVPEEKLCLVVPFSASRHINDGPYAMRLGLTPVKFFTVGTSLIDLEVICRITRGTAEDLAAEKIVIY